MKFSHDILIYWDAPVYMSFSKQTNYDILFKTVCLFVSSGSFNHHANCKCLGPWWVYNVNEVTEKKSMCYYLPANQDLNSIVNFLQVYSLLLHESEEQKIQWNWLVY